MFSCPVYNKIDLKYWYVSIPTFWSDSLLSSASELNVVEDKPDSFTAYITNAALSVYYKFCCSCFAARKWSWRFKINAAGTNKNTPWRPIGPHVICIF